LVNIRYGYAIIATVTVWHRYGVIVLVAIWHGGRGKSPGVYPADRRTIPSGIICGVALVVSWNLPLPVSDRCRANSGQQN